MVKVTKIKPLNQGLVRIEMDVTYGELELALQFNPASLELHSEDQKEADYKVMLGGMGAIGSSVVVLPSFGQDLDDKVAFIIEVMPDSVKTNAALAKVVQKGNLIIEQVKDAVEAYNEALEFITIEE